ncbi:unnamed protein product, partial [Oppiella nova]
MESCGGDSIGTNSSLVPTGRKEGRAWRGSFPVRSTMTATHPHPRQGAQERGGGVGQCSEVSRLATRRIGRSTRMYERTSLQKFIRVMTSSLDCLDCNYVQQSQIWRGSKSEKLDPRNQRTVAMMSSILRILLTVSEANVMAERVTCKGCTTSSS